MRKEKEEEKADASLEEEDTTKAAEGVDVCSICQESVNVGQQDATSLMDCRHGKIHHFECIQILETKKL